MGSEKQKYSDVYDCVIIGAGVIGAAAARTLSRYRLRLLLLERENDVGLITSAANSAIVHSGYDPTPGSLKAKMNVAGNRLFPEFCRQLDVDLKMIGSLTLATDDDQIPVIEELAVRAAQNGVPVEILSRDAVLRREPNLTPEVRCALFAPTAGIVNPFELTAALAENAVQNGVALRLNEEVTRIAPHPDGGYAVTTDRGVYRTLAVINAAGLHADTLANNALAELGKPADYEIRPRKGEYFVLDHFDPEFLHHTIFTVPTEKGKGILVSPTTHGNYLVGPSAEFTDRKDDFATTDETLAQVLASAQKLVPSIPTRQIIRQFAGLRAVEKRGEFVIDRPAPGLVNLLGIQSPGLTACFAIAEKAVALLREDLPLEENPDFNPVCPPRVRLHRMAPDERAKFVAEHPSYGRIVCRCEDVSEGEIVDAIRRPSGATTVDGVKKRTRPGFGKCQGGFCQPQVVKILARELGRKPEEIPLKSPGTEILLEKIGGADGG
ncbi:MAG: NAD(P)/FAD-dependent oxidoreductase [Thermoguttaceae bacterium]|nr:NAD(P)/FAD-dependent oxidoreductase [Thermoguttaceae bacterium]